ncbi:MAG: DUF1302 domain-containing protein [Holophagae bacterium]|jgi:hypothetical protein
MSKLSITRPIHQWRRGGFVLLAAVLMVLFVVPADAAELTKRTSKVRLNLDTTLSWGARYRVSDRDPAIISPFEGGTAFSVNGDDGNLNFDSGSLVSNTLKATIDLEMNAPAGQHDFGIFVRGSGFYDFVLMGDCCERTELTDEALSWAGNRAELLDAFVKWGFPLGKGRGELRVGRQVLNWGENTFIQGGLSAINPVDLNALRVPGSELREAFRPLGMAWGSFDITQNVSVEGFYLWEWEEIVVDPPGTYFSSNDFAGPGGETVFLGFGNFADTGEAPVFVPPSQQPLGYPFLGVPRASTAEAQNDGQYGVALRLFAPGLGGTEFGLYFMNLHSRLPTINGITGSVQGAIAAGASATDTILWSYFILGVPPGVSPEADATALLFANTNAVSIFGDTANWFTGYPEDIKYYGLSWNSQLGTSGVAFQGEVSYRQDAPLQVDDVELLFAALSPLSSRYADASQITNGVPLGFSETALGYRLLDTSQLQFTFTKIVSNFLGADQAAFIGEFGFNKVWDMPSKDELRFESAGTYTSGDPAQAEPGGLHAGQAAEPPEAFADDFSWGYRLLGRLTYNNALGAWTLLPRIAWSHDPQGNSPGPGGPFLDGRMAFTAGLAFNYLSAWEIDISYTDFFGAGRYNLINDRDFIGGFIRFSF